MRFRDQFPKSCEKKTRQQKIQVKTNKMSNDENSTQFALNQIKLKINEAQETLQKIDEVNSKSKSLQSLKTAPLDIEDLVSLDRAHQHLSWLDVITKILEKSKSSKKDSSILIDCHRILVALLTQLMDSSCLHLRNYALQSLIFLRQENLPELEKDLEAKLETLNYPKCVLGIEDEEKNPDLAQIKKFQKTFLLLEELKLPEKLVEKFGLQNSDPSLIVAKPLKKRFIFHFMGTKKTNNPVKPEWYLQQVGKWLKLSAKFFETFIEPIEFDGKSFAKFSSAISGQVLKKLQKDIVGVMYDDISLSHMIDEILTFSQEFHTLGKIF